MTTKQEPLVHVSMTVGEALWLRGVLQFRKHSNIKTREEWETSGREKAQLDEDTAIIESILKALPDDSKPPF